MAISYCAVKKYFLSVVQFAIPARLAWFFVALPSWVLPLVAIAQQLGVGIVEDRESGSTGGIPLTNAIVLAMLVVQYSIRYCL